MLKVQKEKDDEDMGGKNVKSQDVEGLKRGEDTP